MGMSGISGMHAMYGPTDEGESLATLRRALELGINFFDTAEVYGPYRNEELLGRGLAGWSGEVVVASKFGFRIGDDGRIQGTDGSPANARRALDASLQRLGRERIDLWYLHRLDRNVPIEDTVGAMAEGVKSGKVRWLGLSEVGAATLRRACKVHPITALQSEYSLWERNLDNELVGVCRELGVGIVAYCPLGRGFLAGGVASAEELPAGDYRKLDPRFAEANHARNMTIVAAVAEIAERHGVSSAQIALAWLLQHNRDVVPIPGTKRRRYVEENAAAADIRLNAVDIARLDALQGASGPRYNANSMQSIDR